MYEKCEVVPSYDWMVGECMEMHDVKHFHMGAEMNAVHTQLLVKIYAFYHQ